MIQLTTLLAATDLSAPARHAVARAARLAKEADARLALVHVASQGALNELRKLLGTQPEPIEQRVLDQLREELSRLAADTGQPHGVTVVAHLAAGTVLQEILKHADAIDADILVLGARGESFMRHMALGSTAERLLRKTLRPILVVKQTPIDAYRRVLVPVDLSRWSVPALMLARAAAPHAELVVLHAFEVPFEGKLRLAGVQEDTINRYRTEAKQDALQRMRQLVAEAGLDSGVVRFSVRHGDASRHIIEQEQEQDCDLIAIGKHGQNVVEELLLGSVTKHVLAESNCDVLVSTRSMD